MNRIALLVATAAVLAMTGGPLQARRAIGHLNDPPGPPIDQKCPPRTEQQATVGINFDSGFDPHHPKRDIYYEDSPLEAVPPPVHPYDFATPLDFDLSEYLTPRSDFKINTVRIRVYLYDGRFKFSSGDGVVSTPTLDHMFCGLSRGEHKGAKYVQFYAVYAKDLGTNYVGQFDIILDPTNLHGGHFYVDPHVGNNGIALGGAAKGMREGH
jgi:hypothetical protein